MDSSRSTSSTSGPSGYPTHPSRRDNHSISSNHSGKSERGGRSAGPAVESAVTRLLVSIKQLLESLTQWSKGNITEEAVSDVYVRLGNDFNAAVAAFAAFNIDMAELMSVPDDLRTVLEQCLAEDATPDNLEIYLPTVRQIITGLLQGLRGKQSIYRRIMSELNHRSESGHARTDSRSSRSSRREREGTHRSQLSRTIVDGERPNEGERDSVSRRSGQSSSGRRREPPNQNLPPPPPPPPSNDDDRFIGGFAPPPPDHMNGDLSPPPASQHRRQMSIPPPIDSPRQRPESLIPGPSSSSFSNSASSDVLNSPPPPTSSPAAPPVPASVKRYSLVDKPVPLSASSAGSSSTPTLVVEPSSPEVVQQLPNQDSSRRDSATPPPETPPPDGPAIASSLAALKKSDALERRASKRFSTYNISKITGTGTTRERSIRGGLPNRRSLLAAGPTLTPGDLAVLAEEDEGDGPRPDSKPSSRPNVRRQGSLGARSRSRQGSPDGKGRPVPSVPQTPSRSPEPSAPGVERETAEGVGELTPPTSAPPELSKFPVFLQVGREVKKVVIERGLTFSSLRVLFVDKFSYNPGQDNFPAIYIRDPSSGVQYELEDVDEVKDKCLLSLNIEPLDQIKQHIDTQISSLSQDIKELRTVVATNQRHSATFPTIVTQPLTESTPLPNRPTDRQFQTVARRLSRLANHDPSPPLPTIPMIPQMTGQSLQSQMTGGSILSDYTSRVMTDLKTQFDEVQNLRRDLGIMRQLYTEFMKQTKESLGSLRSQTQSVKQLANTSVGGAREYINTGKKKLDIRSQDVLTEVEKLQDAVEGIKDDVLKKQVTPKAQYLKSIERDIQAVASEIDSLKEHINTVKPMWKKTWEEELQNIVEEQQFLTHQEEFLGDLLEDHKALLEVYGHVQKVISLRASAPRMRGFRPPPAEEGQNGVNSLLREIRGASVNPERRIKAIEASQKSREKEKASQTDELHNELTEFVGQKKLRMTGGAEEAERVRQKRSEMTLKAMFNGGGGGAAEPGGGAMGVSPPPGSPYLAPS